MIENVAICSPTLSSSLSNYLTIVFLHAIPGPKKYMMLLWWEAGLTKLVM